jgi:ankyrin repeat protein
MMAVKKEDEDLVRRLLDRGADVHHHSRDGMCALRIAVLRGNMAIARRLLNAGADVSSPFANKETPVEVAEREGYKELAASKWWHGAIMIV